MFSVSDTWQKDPAASVLGVVETHTLSSTALLNIRYLITAGRNVTLSIQRTVLGLKERRGNVEFVEAGRNGFLILGWAGISL